MTGTLFGGQGVGCVVRPFNRSGRISNSESGLPRRLPKSPECQMNACNPGCVEVRHTLSWMLMRPEPKNCVVPPTSFLPLNCACHRDQEEQYAVIVVQPTPGFLEAGRTTALLLSGRHRTRKTGPVKVTINHEINSNESNRGVVDARCRRDPGLRRGRNS